MKQTTLFRTAVAALALAAATSNTQAQNSFPYGVFKDAAVKAQYEKDGPSLSQHLAQRAKALKAWNSISPSLLEPVTLHATVTAKNRGGSRELRIRNFHYIGDCGYKHGGQDTGVETQTTARGVFASDIANSILDQAAIQGIGIDSLYIEIQGQPDKQPTNRVNYTRNFLYTVRIASKATDAQLEKLISDAEQHSPTVNLIKRAVTPQLTIDYKQTPRERTIEGKTLAGLREYIHGKRQALLAYYNPDSLKVQPSPKAAQPSPQPYVRVLSNGVRQLNVPTGGAWYVINHDNPEFLGGSDLGQTSVENTLGVLGTCITHISEIQAAKLNLDVDSLQLTVAAEIDPRAGRKGFEDVPFWPQNVRYTLHVQTPETLATVKQWIDSVEKICPMFNVFKDTQTFEHKIVRI